MFTTRALLCIAALLVGCSTPGTPSDLPREAGTGSVAVSIVGFENDRGQALVAIFLSSEGFPGEIGEAHEARECPVVGQRVSVLFEDVPEGPFAVSVIHDEDLDFELDKNMLGIPSERWGVSRDASGFLGPPSFEKARLQLSADESLAIEVPLG